MVDAEMGERTLCFSIVIANFNYADYLCRAIDSALELDWPQVEVIVVDDGSTDGSAALIRAYGDRIKALFQPNAGQRVANNAGFAKSAEVIVVFLDADDVLEPHFAREVAAAWRPGVSKVQVLMARVDARERPLGSCVPPLTWAPEPSQIAAWARLNGEYPTPPGSGNAYSRSFLEQFLPIGPEHDSSTDSTCLALAPLLGDVVTVAKPLARYRQHGANDSNLWASPDRFGREVARAVARQQSIELIFARLGRDPPPTSLRRNGHLLQLRVASLRMRPGEHSFPRDGRIAIACDALRLMFRRGPEAWGHRLATCLWVWATLLAPSSVAHGLISLRFAPAGNGLAWRRLLSMLPQRRISRRDLPSGSPAA